MLQNFTNSLKPAVSTKPINKISGCINDGKFHCQFLKTTLCHGSVHTLLKNLRTRHVINILQTEIINFCSILYIVFENRIITKWADKKNIIYLYDKHTGICSIRQKRACTNILSIPKQSTRKKCRLYKRPRVPYGRFVFPNDLDLKTICLASLLRR